jgi:hypothetical protein
MLLERVLAHSSDTRSGSYSDPEGTRRVPAFDVDLRLEAGGGEVCVLR